VSIELIGGGGGIKSVQRGVMGYQQTQAVINEVEPEKASVRLVGYRQPDQGDYIGMGMAGLQLDSPTSIAAVFDDFRTEQEAEIYWEVVEYHGAKVQRGTLDMYLQTENDIVISKVKPEKAMINLMWGSITSLRYTCGAELIDAQTLRLRRKLQSSYTYFSWEVIELV
jgi:hypothetical protein